MNFDNARKFLARVVPWDGVSFVNLHYKQTKPGKGKSFGMPGKAFSNIQSFVRSLESRQQHNTLDDIYICMSSQREMAVKQKTNGNTFKVAKRSAANAVALKSFFIDVDVKPDDPKAYPSTKDALAAVALFIKASTLPKPNVIVLSGTGGFHLYWALIEAILPDVWSPWAHALVECARAAGLKFDSQCSVDVARLLRVPDTFNIKITRKPVVLASFGPSEFFLEQITKPLEPYHSKGLQLSKVALVVAPYNNNPNDELSAGITAGKVVPRDIERVAEVCPFVARTLQTGGRDNDQVQWFHTLGIAIYCEDGENVACKLSGEHPAYNQEETAQEFARVKKDHDTRPSLGLTSCATITSSGVLECQTCPHLGKGKRPISLTPISFRPVTLLAKVNIGEGDGDMPPGYYRDPDKAYIHIKDVDDEGQDASHCLIPYPIGRAWVSPSPWMLHFSTSTFGGGEKDVAMPFEAMAGVPNASTAFKREGMSFMVTLKVIEFMTSFIRKLQEQKETVNNAQAFGWFKVDGAVDGFAYNGVRYTPVGEKISPKPENGLAKIYTPEGVDHYWMEAVRIINAQKRPALDAIVASAFAAPLMSMTGHPGVTVGGWSLESGIGKSTALALAQTVWGSPRGMMGLSDTQNKAFKVAGSIRNLPLLWDEIKGHDQTVKFVNSAFDMSRGYEKGRLRRDLALADQGEWETMMVFCSNASVQDAIVEVNRTTTAGGARVFEFCVPPGVNTVPKAHMATLMGHVKSNYGWSGIRYARYLGENEPAVRHQIEQRGLTLERKFGVGDDERLWLAVVNAILTGASYANMLCLTEIDMSVLTKFLINEFRRMQEAKKDSPNDFSRADTVAALMAQFLTEKRSRNTLLTDDIHIARNRCAIGSIRILNEGPETNKLEAIQVQIGGNARLIRISEAALTEWLKAKGVPRAAVFTALSSLLMAQRIHIGRLGVGTRFGSGAEPLWEIAASQVGLLD